jgi:ADP-heptose:LPS heptosyltransferase
MNLLVIRPAALGDSLMLMPSLCALKGMAETTLVGRRPGIDFLAPYVHQAMDFESHGWHLLYAQESEGVSSLPLPSVDLAVLFHSDPHGELASRLEDSLPGVQVRVFPGFPPEHTQTHAALYLALCLEASGCPINAAQAFEHAVEVPLLKQSALEKEAKQVILHPGSGSAKKNHPPQFWLDFAKRLSQSHAFPLILLLGPAEEALLPFFQEHLQWTAGAEILFCPDRATLLSTFSQAALYAGQDSGITHLAAMIGAPTLALFRSSSIARWRPLGPLVRTVESEESGPRLLDEALSKAAELLR